MRLYGRWRVALPDEEWTWEPDEVTLGECLMIEGEHGGSFDDWVRQVGDGRAEACQVLVWFLRRKAGQQVDRASVDFPIRKLTITYVEPESDGESDPEAGAPSEGAT